MPRASPRRAGECWPAVKIPSTSETLRPASRTALVTASRWSVSWLLPGRFPISSLSSTPTTQAELLSAFMSAVAVTGRLEQGQRDLVGQLREHDLHRHVALDRFGVGLDVDQVRHHARPFRQLDHREHVGWLDLPRLVEDLVGDFEGVERAPAACLDPADVARRAAWAHGARIEEDVATRLALGQQELLLPETVPEGLGLRGDGAG